MNAPQGGSLAELPPLEEAAVSALRATMERAGSAFDFTVLRVPDPAVSVGVVHHRAVLGALFDRLAGRYGGLQFSIGQASALPLDAFLVRAAGEYPPGWRVDWTRQPKTVPWFEHFAQAFDDPPYGLRPDNAREHAQMFPRLCACTGLMPGQGIEVFDWVGDPEAESHRSDWSNYFDDGKEWWGIWCLTVWNPRHRTLAAIAASATD